LPPRAALLALVGVVVGLALSIGQSLLGLAAGLPRTVRLVVSQAGLWTGLVGACWLASRRFGRGSVVGDFGLRVRGADVGWGLLAALAARFAVGMAVLPFMLSGSKRLLGANDRVFRVVKDDPAGFVVVAVLAVIGAPVVEELFFRGLLQGSLLSSLGVAQAIVVQAVLFGLAHVNPILGLANVTVVVAITAAGIVFGVTAGRRGLPSSMVAHGAFNAVAVAVAATL
jgi:membrane protease YdiL (CAAX protease family)